MKKKVATETSAEANEDTVCMSDNAGSEVEMSCIEKGKETPCSEEGKDEEGRENEPENLQEMETTVVVNHFYIRIALYLVTLYTGYS